MDWNTFFVVSSGVSATLVGLLFIGVQMNIDKIGSDLTSTWSRLGRSTYAMFVLLFLGSLIFLVPSVSDRVRAQTILGLAAAGIGRTLFGLWTVLRQTPGTTDRAPRRLVLLAAPIIGFGLAAAGALTWVKGLRSADDARELIAMGFYVLYALALRSSWTLLFDLGHHPGKTTR